MPDLGDAVHRTEEGDIRAVRRAARVRGDRDRAGQDHAIVELDGLPRGGDIGIENDGVSRAAEGERTQARCPQGSAVGRDEDCATHDRERRGVGGRGGQDLDEAAADDCRRRREPGVAQRDYACELRTADGDGHGGRGHQPARDAQVNRGGRPFTDEDVCTLGVLDRHRGAREAQGRGRAQSCRRPQSQQADVGARCRAPDIELAQRSGDGDGHLRHRRGRLDAQRARHFEQSGGADAPQQQGVGRGDDELGREGERVRDHRGVGVGTPDSEQHIVVEIRQLVRREVERARSVGSRRSAEHGGAHAADRRIQGQARDLDACPLAQRQVAGLDGQREVAGDAGREAHLFALERGDRDESRVAGEVDQRSARDGPADAHFPNGGGREQIAREPPEIRCQADVSRALEDRRAGDDQPAEHGDLARVARVHDAGRHVAQRQHDRLADRDPTQAAAALTRHAPGRVGLQHQVPRG